jgi:purine-nucleoside phosphorylase
MFSHLIKFGRWIKHINFPGLAGINPLRGFNLDIFGPRFIALSDAYDLDLRRIAHLIWKELPSKDLKMALHKGVYAFVGGPKYVIHQNSVDAFRLHTQI